MREEREGVSKAPSRKMKFAPRIPPRKAAKPTTVKTEKSEIKDNTVDKELLSKLNRAKSQDTFGRRFPKNDKKDGPSDVAFGHGSSSAIRFFAKSQVTGNESSESQKVYVEPWDYINSYYPTTLPLRRPYSGNPEILDKEEFGEASAGMGLDENKVNPAMDLDLMGRRDETQMLFFQFPASLPLPKQSATAADDKDTHGKRDRAPIKGSKLEELPSGPMGKLMVYKSGKIKLKLGDALYDVFPGANCSFPQEVVAINRKEKHCCVVGEVGSRAVVIPDVDSLLDSIDDMDLTNS